MFKLFVAFFINSFGLNPLPDLFSIILLFRRIFLVPLFFVLRQKPLGLVVKIVILFDALSLFISFAEIIDLFQVLFLG